MENLVEEICIELDLPIEEAVDSRTIESGEAKIRILRDVIARVKAEGDAERARKLENRLRTAEADLAHMKKTGEFRQIHV